MARSVFQSQLSLCVGDKIVSASLCFRPKIKALKYLLDTINKHKDYTHYKLSVTEHGRKARTGKARVFCAPSHPPPSGTSIPAPPARDSPLLSPRHPYGLRAPPHPSGSHDECKVD